MSVIEFEPNPIDVVVGINNNSANKTEESEAAHLPQVDEELEENVDDDLKDPDFEYSSSSDENLEDSNENVNREINSYKGRPERP